MLKLSMWRDKLSSYKVQNFLLSCLLCIQIVISCSSFGSKQYTVFSLMRFLFRLRNYSIYITKKTVQSCILKFFTDGKVHKIGNCKVSFSL